VTRGGLLATFERKPYPEAIRLGLSEEEEVAFRKTFPERDGVLVVKQIVPAGPLSDVAQVGDIILALNDQRLSDFVTLDAILDAHVGETVALRLQRDGEVIEANVTVADLHAVSPDVLIEGCDAVFNDLSYQVARHYMIPIRGVNIASSGYCFDRAGVFRGNVITAIDEEPVESVVELWSILQDLDDDQAIEVTYFSLSEPTRQQRTVVHWDRTWFPLERWQRNDSTGVWDIEHAKEIEPTPKNVLYPAPDYSTQQTLLPKKDKWGETVQRALVTVRFAIPIPVQGVYGESFFGAGVIVDAELGLVAVDRDTVPIALGDLEVIFAGEVRVPAKVVYVHPEHNVTLVQFEPSLIPNADFKEVDLVDEPTEGPLFKENQKVHLYGMDYNYVVHGSSEVMERDQFLQMPMPRTPFFRESNLDVAALNAEKKLVGGVVLNKKGQMLGQWASFPDLSSYEQERSMYVVPAYTIREALDAFTQQNALRSIGVEFAPLNWIQATEFGLTSAMLNEFEGDGRPEEWFSVHRMAPSAPAAQVLRNGDIILAVEGKRLFHFRHLERLMRQKDVVLLHVLRQGTIQEVMVTSIALASLSETTVLKWNGALIHNVPWFTSMQTGISMEGAYIAKCASGAPCGRDGVWGKRRIVTANQQPVSSVEDLIAILQDPELPNDVRLQVVNLKGRPDTVVLRRDERYWRSEVIQWDATSQSWIRQTLTMDSETSN
jgi:S1-C subfamily serine protease